MFDYEYRKTTTAGRVCLELSLKPFGWDKTPEGIQRTAEKLFTQWKPFLSYAEGVSVLLWTSDGSEILEYTGNLDDSFEWCKYIGIGNWNRNVKPEDDPDNRSFHHYPILYIPDPPEMTYGDLKAIIAALKKAGKEITGFSVEVGETFDPGPEFAYSPFKYERHPEISVDGVIMGKPWMHCGKRLHAEDHAYAAYPDGIPEGTHIGEFLGRQFMAMKRDLGFDYIWLSNGFGFSLASWNWTGELFDGKRFDFANAEQIRENLAAFWKHFSKELGDTRVETRGSNLSAGMDIAAHGCPIDEIYRQNIVAPPNSPWAPLNYRFGLELAGFMTHIADLPERGFNIRYYIHDPWWLNSPWFDRYDRSPHDIYLPLCIARLDERAEVTKPFGIGFLSADDGRGRLPDRCPNEVTPHLLTAFNDYPDEAGLLTWVYPIDTYCKKGLREGKMQDIFMDDWFMESALDKGLPVNTVISDRNFIAADKTRCGKMLVTPVPDAGSELEDALLAAMDAGTAVMLYGSMRSASPRLWELVGVDYGTEIDGTLHIETTLPLDSAEVGQYADTLVHVPLVSGGGIGELPNGKAQITAFVEKDGEKRAYASFCPEKKLIWVRGSFPHNAQSRGALPSLLPPSKSFGPALLLRASMALLGYPITFSCYDIDDNLPIIMLSKCRNALWLNEFSKDATVKIHLTTPDGVPAFDNSEFLIENDMGTFPASRWNHTEARIFIKQKARSKITIKKNNIETYINCDELFELTGLADADLTIFPTKGGIAEVRAGIPTFKVPNVPLSYDAERGCYTARHVSGNISVAWQEKENIGDYIPMDFLHNHKEDSYAQS